MDNLVAFLIGLIFGLELLGLWILNHDEKEGK